MKRKIPVYTVSRDEEHLIVPCVEEDDESFEVDCVGLRINHWDSCIYDVYNKLLFPDALSFHSIMHAIVEIV